MAYEQRDLSGALFRETDKKSDEAPDYTGSCRVSGVAYRMAGWVRVSKQGNKFLSVKFELDS